jgi:hypothetical protein
MKLKCLIYGQAGAGKTSVALSAPKPLLLDFDGGVHRVHYGHQTDTVQIRSWKDCEDVLSEDLSPYESIVIDTGGKLLDFMSEHIVAKNPKLGKLNGALTLPGFGERKGLFRQFCKRIMMMQKHLIFVAHRDAQKNNEEIRYVPLFGGSSYDDLVTDLDLVGYLETVGRKRTVTFDPTDRNDGKNTCNLPSAMELPVIVDAAGHALPNSFLQKSVIEPYIANLQNRIDAGKKYVEVIAELKDSIALITDDISANDFIRRIDKFGHAGNSKAVAGLLLNAKAKELKLKFDKEKKVYERAS